ncbi:MAG: histidinol dehydrogenase [Chitinispirillaceae bacterium]|nr:histidinol dehydrogenase [Chitinispirillaceae bacterium]
MKRPKRIPVIDYSKPSGKRYLNAIVSLRQKRDAEVVSRVARIVEAVREGGDRALFSYTRKFDRVQLSAETVRIGPDEINTQARARRASSALKQAISAAAQRIRAYHSRQGLKAFSMTTAEGRLRQIVRPLRRVAVYVPGGHTVYPSSVLMNVIPAQAAGVPEIVVVTPPRKGPLDAGIAFALKICNVKECYRIGGPQAVAALAYGTASIRPVDKIVGPGNAYVQAAKRLVYGTVDIDSAAGPSEVVIIADGSARPDWVALDLLAQAEHGSGDEIALAVTESRAAAEKIAAAVAAAIAVSPVRSALIKLPAHAITVFRTAARAESIALVNAVAPEHLQIMTRSPEKDLRCVKNAAAVFIGAFTPAALGDYYIGTNHVLPTGGAARFASPLGVESFQKRMSAALVTEKGLRKSARAVSAFARAENFAHHALSVERRLTR